MKIGFTGELKKRIYAAVAVLLALAIVAGTGIAAFLNNRRIARAIFDPANAVTFREFKGKRNIDESVIFIGTYLLHKDALNDQLYNKAKNSATQSGQDGLYYKSELADGSWFDLGDVDNGLRGISSEGKPVPETRIDPLYVQYYAGADGILIDCLTNLPVNPFDIPDPYDLKNLEELQSLWMQYNNSQSAEEVTLEQFLENRGSSESGKLRTDVYLYQLLHTFFALDLRDENANLYSRQLSQLNAAYINLKEKGAEDEAALAFEMMEKVDAKRRAEVFEKLAELDINALDTLFTLTSGSYYTSYGEFKDSSSEDNAASEPDYVVEIQDAVKHKKSSTPSAWMSSWMSRLGINTGSTEDWWATLEKEEKKRRERDDENYEKIKEETDDDEIKKSAISYEYPFVSDNALLDAIGTCISECEKSYIHYMSLALTDSDRVLAHAEYVYSDQVISDSSAAGLGGPITQLKHVRNIAQSSVIDAEGELSMITGNLVDQASSYYAGALAEGEPDGYGDLVGEGAKKSAIEDQNSLTEARRSELEFLIDGVRMRDTAANALEYTYQRIDWAEAQFELIPEDDAEAAATASLEAHIKWLKDLAARIKNSDEDLKSDLDKLKDKKEELQMKRDSALDNNDLSGAAAYDAKIEAVDQDIADEEARLSDLMNEGTAGDQAAAQNSAGNSADALAKQLVDKAVEKLSDNANADLSSIADALAGLGAEDALKELADKAEASGASDGTVDVLKDAADKAGSGDGSGDGLGDGSGDGFGSGLTADDLLAAILGLFGDLENMSDDEIAAVTAALSRFTRMGCQAAGPLTLLFNNRGVSTGNKYFYTQYPEDQTTEYVSLKTVGECTPFRYFYDDSKRTATMTKGSRIYIMLRGSDDIYKGSTENDPETMTRDMVFSGVPYIDEADSQTYFSCLAEYVIGASSAVCCTETVETMANELLEIFKSL